MRHRLTAQGEQARVRGVEVVRSVFPETLGVLTDAELDTLRELLRRVDP